MARVEVLADVNMFIVLDTETEKIESVRLSPLPCFQPGYYVVELEERGLQSTRELDTTEPAFAKARSIAEEADLPPLSAWEFD